MAPPAEILMNLALLLLFLAVRSVYSRTRDQHREERVTRKCEYLGTSKTKAESTNVTQVYEIVYF